MRSSINGLFLRFPRVSRGEVLKRYTAFADGSDLAGPLTPTLPPPGHDDLLFRGRGETRQFPNLSHSVIKGQARSGGARTRPSGPRAGQSLYRSINFS